MADLVRKEGNYLFEATFNKHDTDVVITDETNGKIMYKSSMFPRYDKDTFKIVVDRFMDLFQDCGPMHHADKWCMIEINHRMYKFNDLDYKDPFSLIRTVLPLEYETYWGEDIKFDLLEYPYYFTGYEKNVLVCRYGAYFYNGEMLCRFDDLPKEIRKLEATDLSCADGDLLNPIRDYLNEKFGLHIMFETDGDSEYAWQDFPILKVEEYVPNVNTDWSLISKAILNEFKNYKLFAYLFTDGKVIKQRIQTKLQTYAPGKFPYRTIESHEMVLNKDQISFFYIELKRDMNDIMMKNKIDNIDGVSIYIYDITTENTIEIKHSSIPKEKLQNLKTFNMRVLME